MERLESKNEISKSLVHFIGKVVGSAGGILVSF